MKKYSFVVKLTAKDNNPNFKGCVVTYVYGPNNTCGQVGEGMYSVPAFTRIWGYNRKCDAVRQMKWHEANMTEEFWDREYKLIELEV